MPKEFNLLPEAARQSCAFSNILVFLSGNVVWNEVDVIHVTEAPVSNSHENILPPALTVTLDLTLSPLKGVIWFKKICKWWWK